MTGGTRRLLRGGLVALVVLAVAAVVGVAVAFPAVAATTCPGCYGMVQARPGVYVEPGSSIDEERHVLAVVDEALRQVDGFFGGLVSSPSFLGCRSDTCYARIGGGGERGVAVLNRAVMLSPRGLDPVIATHELTHVELHARLRGATVPQWFDEGLAVLVSGDARYLAEGGDRCLVEPAGPLPSTLPEWLRAASADPQVYAQAACRVSRLAAAHDMRALVAQLADGAPVPGS
ncbi:hypothetical protein WEH80_03020 [Actinomycetes bacterium KLBMP 9759]